MKILFFVTSAYCILSNDNKTLATEHGKWQVTRNEIFYEQEDSLKSHSFGVAETNNKNGQTIALNNKNVINSGLN